MKKFRLFVVIVLLLMLTACQNINNEKSMSKDNNIKQTPSFKEKNITPSPTEEVTPTAQPTPTLSPTATPTITPAPTATPEPIPIPRTITLQKTGDSDNQFDFKPYKYRSTNQVTVQNGYTFSIHQNTIIAYSIETDESFLFKEIDEDKYGGIVDVMSIEKTDNDKINIYYTAELRRNSLDPKYEDLYSEYLSNYPMSALYSSLSEKPIIDFIFTVIEVENDKIIYLAEDMKQYAFDMQTKEITDLNKDVSDLFNTDWYSVDYQEDLLQKHHITYNENNENIMKIYSRHDHENEICGYKLPIDNRLEDVMAIGDLIYLVYSEDNDVVTIYVLDTTNSTLYKLYSEACECFNCMLVEGKLVAMYHDFEESIKIITYDEGDDDCKIVYTGECHCNSREQPEYDAGKFHYINYMFYKGNRIFGYNLTEARIGIQYFVTDIISLD